MSALDRGLNLDVGAFVTKTQHDTRQVKRVENISRDRLSPVFCRFHVFCSTLIQVTFISFFLAFYIISLYSLFFIFLIIIQVSVLYYLNFNFPIALVL
jgi:Ca2+-dependent lipid-binding protein